MRTTRYSPERGERCLVRTGADAGQQAQPRHAPISYLVLLPLVVLLRLLLLLVRGGVRLDFIGWLCVLRSTVILQDVRVRTRAVLAIDLLLRRLRRPATQRGWRAVVVRALPIYGLLVIGI